MDGGRGRVGKGRQQHKRERQRKRENPTTDRSVIKLRHSSDVKMRYGRWTMMGGDETVSDNRGR